MFIFIDNYIYSWFIITARNRKAQVEISLRNFALLFSTSGVSDDQVDVRLNAYSLRPDARWLRIP